MFLSFVCGNVNCVCLNLCSCVTMDTSHPSRPVQYATMLNSPLKLKTTSVPTTGKFFKVEDVNQDLLVELEGVTIDEDALTAPSHYILDQCNKIISMMITHIPQASSPLTIPSFKHGKEFLYCNGCWVSSKIPQMLREKLLPSSNRLQSTHHQHKTIHRPVPSTSQEETIEGTFIPTAGSEEQQIANWLNIITDALCQGYLLKSANTTVTAPTVTGKRIMHSMATVKHHLWSSDTSCKSMKGDMPWKPDLVLQEESSFLVAGPMGTFL